MKKNPSLISFLACVLAAVALVVSLVSLISSNSALEERVLALENNYNVLAGQNLELQNRLSALTGSSQGLQTDLSGTSDPYCNILVNDWSSTQDKLTIDAFAQVYLGIEMEFTAQVELRLDGDVLVSRPILLAGGEALGSYEGDFNDSFNLPKLEAGDELQLWLQVQPKDAEAFYAPAAGWYLDQDGLKLITG